MTADYVFISIQGNEFINSLYGVADNRMESNSAKVKLIVTEGNSVLFPGRKPATFVPAGGSVWGWGEGRGGGSVWAGHWVGYCNSLALIPYLMGSNGLVFLQGHKQ